MLTRIQFALYAVATSRRVQILMLLTWLILIVVGVVGAEGGTGSSICPSC